MKGLSKSPQRGRNERTVVLLVCRFMSACAHFKSRMFNRVGNAPRVERRGTRFRHSLREALPTLRIDRRDEQAEA